MGVLTQDNKIQATKQQYWTIITQKYVSSSSETIDHTSNEQTPSPPKDRTALIARKTLMKDSYELLPFHHN